MITLRYFTLFYYFLLCLTIHSIAYAKVANSNESIQNSPNNSFVIYLPVIDSLNPNTLASQSITNGTQSLLYHPWLKIPKLAYRFQNLMPMFGVGYYGLHQDDSLTGQRAQGVFTWSVGVRYYFYQNFIQKNIFSVFLDTHVYWSHVIQTQDELTTTNIEQEFEESAYNYEFSLGAQHALNPHFHLGASVGVYAYTYSKNNVKETEVYEHTWYQSVIKMFIQLEFF